MPRLTQDRHALKRAHIIDSAEICFARTGFHRTTMQDIARQAGLSAGALYIYFDSKEALIEGIVARDREEIAEILANLGRSGDFFGAMERALQVCVLDRPPHKVGLFVEIIAEAHRNARVAQSLAHCDRVLRAMLADLITQARDEGRLPPGLPAESLALVMAMLGDAMFVRRAGSAEFDGAQVAPVILAMVRQLIMMESGEAEAARPAPAVQERGLVQ